MKKVIITGATSMIGKALADLVTGLGIQATLIIRPDTLKKDLLNDIKNAQIIPCDLSRLGSLIGQLTPHDLFFHLGWSGTTSRERNEPDIHEQNVKYSLDACKLAHSCRCHTFLFAGSQAEYGFTNNKLTPYLPVSPQTAYGVSKYAAGKLTQISCKGMDMKHIWSRILSVYGPNDGPSTMITSCLSSILQNKEFKTTPAEQIWDYLYVTDAARILYALAENGKTGIPYPVGSGKGRALKEFLNVIGEVTGRGELIKIGALPYPEGKKPHLCSDNTETEKDAGVHPEVPFEEGIAETMEHLKKTFLNTKGVEQ